MACSQSALDGAARSTFTSLRSANINSFTNFFTFYHLLTLLKTYFNPGEESNHGKSDFTYFRGENICWTNFHVKSIDSLKQQMYSTTTLVYYNNELEVCCLHQTHLFENVFVRLLYSKNPRIRTYWIKSL